MHHERLAVGPDEAEDLPEGQEVFIELNAQLSQQWEVISDSEDPLPDADDWKDKSDKLEFLER